MKKIFAIALSLSAVFAANAQSAKEETKALYESGKNAEATFNKSIDLARQVGEMDPTHAYGLVEAYGYYMQVLPLDSMPDEKGKVKPKHSKNIIKSINNHIVNNHYQNAAIFLYNKNERFPKAYEAFMLAGSLPRDAKFAEAGKLMHDTVCAENFYNAGLCAYAAQAYDKSQQAFELARAYNYPAKEAHTYEIASLQQLENKAKQENDSVKAAFYAEAVHLCAKDAVQKFGTDDVYFFNNYINKFFINDDYESARKLINEELAKSPNNANLYSVRAKTYSNDKNYEQAAADFIKSSELSDMFLIVKENASELNKIGKYFLGNIGMNDKAGKLEIKQKYFDKAMVIANKAKTLAGDDARSLSDIDYLIEDIVYNIGNCEN